MKKNMEWTNYNREQLIAKTFIEEEVNECMNEWKEHVTSPADSYIEWRFEYKCKISKDEFDYITEWRRHKQEYMGKSSTTAFDYQHYSIHDSSHSVKILEAIELILGKTRIDLLSASDLWLLLETAYGHDLGMVTNYDELERLWKEDEEFKLFIQQAMEKDFDDLSIAALYYKEADNLLSNRDKMENLQGKDEVEYEGNWPIIMQRYIMLLAAEYIRKNHAKRVMEIQEMIKGSKIKARMYRVAKIASSLHGEDFQSIFEKLKYRDDGFGIDKMHPQFAAAMLRIGDVLDIDNNRFNPYVVKHFGRLPISSLIHLEKHEAVTHLDVSQSRVEAEAHTDDYKVAVVIDDWFQSIDREITELICHWNDIVPEALKGCTLKKSECQVYLKQKDGEVYQKFGNEQRKEFSINKAKLINLLIGTSIYDSDMEFLREYLQNALDATKMQLWIDLKAGKYKNLKNPKISDYEKLTPFDIDKRVYENYKITIKVNWNKKQDKIKLEICDNGIGIEGNYLNFLSDIGTGWRGRDDYQKIQNEMVTWLKPTGGFGIGIQSAFMVTDIIEICTKSETDSYGYKVTLQSPKKGGTISTECMSKCFTRGTIVTLEIKPEYFQKWMGEIQKYCHNKSEKPVNEIIVGDEFNLDINLQYACEILKRYIQNVLKTSLFPIELEMNTKEMEVNKGFHCEINNYWEKTSNNCAKKVDVNNKEYLCIYQNNLNTDMNKKVLVWNNNDSILFWIDIKNGELSQPYAYFKNVEVRRPGDKKFGIFENYQLYIDFMGMDAEKCLKVHRNSFAEEFPLEKYCKECIEAYLNFLYSNYQISYEKIDIIKEIASIWTTYPIQLLRLIVFKKMEEGIELTENEEIEVIKYMHEITSDNQVILNIKKSKISQKELLVYLQNFYNKFLKKEVNEDRENTNLKNIILKNVDIMKLNKNSTKPIHPSYFRRHQENMEMEDECDYIVENVEKGIGILNDEFTINMLLKDTNLISQIIELPDKKQYIVLKFISETKVVEEEQLIDILCQVPSAKDAPRKYVTGKSIKKYEALLVNAFPYKKKVLEDSNQYIISPISREKYNNAKEEMAKNKCRDFNAFKEIVWGKKGEEFFEYWMLIQWVATHQCDGSNYTKKDIIDAYTQLLRGMYNYIISGNK